MSKQKTFWGCLKGRPVRHLWTKVHVEALDHYHLTSACGMVRPTALSKIGALPLRKCGNCLRAIRD